MQPVIVAMLGACFLLWIPIPKKPEDLKGKSKARDDMRLEEVMREEADPIPVAIPASS